MGVTYVTVFSTTLDSQRDNYRLGLGGLPKFLGRSGANGVTFSTQ